MAALLDELMGANRNGDRAEEVISDFRDERLCRNYMCGFCAAGEATPRSGNAALLPPRTPVLTFDLPLAAVPPRHCNATPD